MGEREIFCKIDGVFIPRVTTGTSPFIGAGQFGYRALAWREKFLENPEAMVEILEASYQAGARGIQAIPVGKILEAAKIMIETHKDYVITGSTYPHRDPGIDALVDAGAKLIFVHGIIADDRGEELLRLINEVNSRGILSGIATHDPVPTLKHSIENALDVNAFLIPFNANGTFIDDKEELESIVDNARDYSFIGMKTLAAGAIKPKKAFTYISEHNICAVSIGMVTVEEAEVSTKIALESLQK